MSELKTKLMAVENGRFARLIDALDVRDVCGKCNYFDKSATPAYRCACPGSCIGVTLSPNLKQYLIERIGPK